MDSLDKYEEFLLFGNTSLELSELLNQLSDELPKEYADKLARIRLDYMMFFGFLSPFQRMNGKTLKQVFEEYEKTELPQRQPIASGEVDGTKFTLYSPLSGEEEKADDGKDRS